LQRFFKIYVRGFKGASQLRIQLINAHSTDEVRELLAAFTRNELTK
ncbi:tRNA-dihydrouridine synthase, partial [Bacillus thuringiensis]